MGQNNDLPARVLSTLKAELMAAGADSNRLISALEKFGESIEKDLIPGIKNKISLPFEIEKAVLKTELENRKRQAVKQALKKIDDILYSMLTDVERAEMDYFTDLNKLERKQ